jgi:hypothetical protein
VFADAATLPQRDRSAQKMSAVAHAEAASDSRKTVDTTAAKLPTKVATF